MVKRLLRDGIISAHMYVGCALHDRSFGAGIAGSAITDRTASAEQVVVPVKKSRTGS